MSTIDPREFGALEARVESIQQELAEHKRESKQALAEATAKIDELLVLANKGRGAWWAALTLASAFSGLATYVTSHFFQR